jgi:hypothetical protein
LFSVTAAAVSVVKENFQVSLNGGKITTLVPL